MHAEFVENVLGVRQHVHQVRDRRALVAGDVGHAGLQQRLGHGQDSLAAEFLARTETELLDLLAERPLGHQRATSASTRSGLPVPPAIFNGAVIRIAPLGGSLSRFARLASPNLLAPCMKVWHGNGGSKRNA